MWRGVTSRCYLLFHCQRPQSRSFYLMEASPAAPRVPLGACGWEVDLARRGVRAVIGRGFGGRVAESCVEVSQAQDSEVIRAIVFFEELVQKRGNQVRMLRVRAG